MAVCTKCQRNFVCERQKVNKYELKWKMQVQKGESNCNGNVELFAVKRHKTIEEHSGARTLRTYTVTVTVSRHKKQIHDMNVQRRIIMRMKSATQAHGIYLKTYKSYMNSGRVKEIFSGNSISYYVLYSLTSFSHPIAQFQ